MKRIIRRLGLCVCLLLIQSVASDRANWIGTYHPISAVCSGSVLVIKEASVTYAGCKDVGMRVQSSTKDEFSFEVSDDPKCLLRGWILSLRRAGSDVDLTAYRNLKDKSSRAPAIECTYKRQAAKSAAAEK